MSALFLDANIYLDFYRFGVDDIVEMEKLIAIIEGKEVKIFANQHLHDEVARNREKVLAQSLSDLRSKNHSIKLPNYCGGLDERKSLNEALKEANIKHSELVSKVSELISQKSLEADKLISTINEISSELNADEKLLTLARQRVEFGNPPGKNGSLGDSLHWESLLANKSIYHLDFVSRDADFASELEPNKFKDFLSSEWKEKKGSWTNITLFRSLGDYFKTRYPDIMLSDEQDKNDLIAQLQTSPNFSTTHFLIAKLEGYSFFTNQQIIDLFEALAENSQVGWIGTDDDVNQFFKSLKPKAHVVPVELWDPSKEALEVGDDFFGIPF